MSNYEYIVSSLPDITPGWKFGDGTSFGTYVEWIKSQLGSSDKATVDTLLDGFDEEKLCKEFYEAALKDKNRFIREYFTFDLNLRNTKARFLNKAFGFPEDKDTILLPTGDFDEEATLETILSKTDILERERGLDNFVWNSINELTRFNYFDMDTILGAIAKLHIVQRWAALDPETGREMFTRLLYDVRGTYGNVEYVATPE